MFTADVRVQVPPRPPKRQSKDCLFFCQSSLAKTDKNPWFSKKNGNPGAFCSVMLGFLVRYCYRLFLSNHTMLVFSVGRSPSWGRVVFVFICGWFLALCMVVTLLPAKALAVVLSAWGGIPPLNVNGVYQIYTADQLYWFAAQVSGGNGKIYGKLVADIVVSENVLNEDGSLNGDGSLFRPREPIGNVINPYYSTFDGNNKTISGLYYHSDKFVRDVGLFGNIAGTAKVKNLGLVDSYIDGASSTGGVVGFSSGSVQQCYNEATIIGDYKVGGVVGYNYGTEKMSEL